MRAVPFNQVTLFLRNRNSTPFVLAATTSPLRACIRARSSFRPSTSTPWSLSASFAFSNSSDDCSNALGVQDTPARWVGIHRKHHEHADEQPDPHSPLAGFVWVHIGWMIYRNRDLSRLTLISHYAKDVIRDPFYAKLEQNFCWVRVILISW